MLHISKEWVSAVESFFEKKKLHSSSSSNSKTIYSGTTFQKDKPT